MLCVVLTWQIAIFGGTVLMQHGPLMLYRQAVQELALTVGAKTLHHYNWLCFQNLDVAQISITLLKFSMAVTRTLSLSKSKCSHVLRATTAHQG